MPTRESHPISSEALDKWKQVAEKHLKGVKGKYDIESVIRELSPEEPYRTLPSEMELVLAIRHGTCLYFYFTDLLLDRTGQRKEADEAKKSGIPITPSILEKNRFTSTYSLFAMASSIAGHCEKALKGKDPAKLAKLDATDFELVSGKGPSNDLTFLLSSFMDALTLASKDGAKLIDNADDTIAISRDFWKTVATKAGALARQSPPELLRFVDNTTFHYGTFSLTGLQAEERREVKVISWAPVEPHEVIGDLDVTIIIRRLCDRLALYDSVLQKNPMNEFGGLLESILIDGPPGTGKTTRQRMMMTLIARRAEQVGLATLFKSVTADQIKSEWYGKTAQLVGELLKAVQDPLVLALLFVDDIDLLFSGDRDASGTSGADKDIMKALMDFFSGTGTNYIGNYIAVAATNKPTATDDALRQRFVYRAIIKGPETWEDYADLAAIELRKFAKTGLLKVGRGKYDPLKRPLPQKLAEVYNAELMAKYAKKKDGTWEDIGRFCEDLHQKDPKFTGRPVKNAIQVAIAQAADFEIPEEWFTNPEKFRGKSWDERIALLRELYRPLTPDMILMALEHQYEVEGRYASEAYRKRVNDFAQELKVRIEAESVALGKK